MSRSPRRTLRREGFTLVELMVAMFAGMVAIAAIYYISASSSKHFHEQQRVAQTQTAVRMAVEQLRRDISRAGLLGTPNSARETACVAPVTPLQAVEYTFDADTDALPNADENNVRADRLRLVGNYATADEYAVQSISTAGTTIFLQQNWQGFRRDFGVPGGVAGEPPFSPEAFNEAFRVGRRLRVSALNGRFFFPTITGADPARQSIDILPAISAASAQGCVEGLNTGARVAPLSRIEYIVTDRTGDTMGRLAPVDGVPGDVTTDFFGASGSQLIRREIAFGAPFGPADILAEGTERVVLEYVSSFELAFTWDTTTIDGQPPVIVRAAGLDNETLSRNTPHRVRSAIVSVSARTADQDPTYPFIARAAGAPLTRYRVNPSLEGASRVRQANLEIFLPNVAIRNIRP